MLNPNDVVLAYRLMLGREPENEEVINNLCQTVHSVGRLRDAFIGSSEFRQRMGDILGQQQNVRQRHPFNLPSIPVEVNVSASDIDLMFDRIHQEWEFLGEADPYWSVVTQPQYHLDDFETHREQFFRSGKYSSDLFLSCLRRNSINPNLHSVCLEVGCGVGRVTRYLSRNFESLIATDISSKHLAIARRHLSEEGVKNVELIQLETIRAINNLPRVDAVFSVITLQHNPPPVMAWMIRALLGLLNDGGVAYLQIPTYKSGYLFEVGRYLASQAPKSLEMHFLPQSEVFKLVADGGCRCLEIREDAMVGEEDKMLSNTFLIQKNK